MSRWMRLTLIVVTAVTVICLLTAGLLALRSVLGVRGYDMSPLVFIALFFIVVGAVYGFAANLVVREGNSKSTDVSRTPQDDNK